MQLLQKLVSNTLCCFGVYHEDVPERPAALRNLPNNVSNISMTMPTASIPNVASTSEELRKIFASDATPGGYNAAANGPPRRLPPQGSLDMSFQFGSPVKPTKSAGRVEQITHHIKLRLSESRLSKNSMGETTPDAELGRWLSGGRTAADESTELLGVSQRSTGLTDLLTSRAGSEGGYDSDARSIQTPMLQSNAGTLRTSPAFARKSLKTILSESSQEPFPLQARRVEDAESTTPGSRRAGSKSSPFPMTPAKTSFTTAMQMTPNESPSATLRRLSRGIANGTIKVPDTPELRALRLPSTSEVENEWRLSMRAPQRVSSLLKCNTATGAAVKRLSDCITTAKRQSSKSSSSKDQYTNLISELDPALLEYIERYASGHELQHSPSSSPTTVIKIRDKNIIDDKHVDRSRLTLTTQSLANSTNDLSSASTSAELSLHLFNMRISQRLASNSRAPMLSSANSNNTSARSLTTPPDLDIVHQSRGSSISRYPTFISTEHNCYPSDPETRRKFESVHKSQGDLVDRMRTSLQTLDSTVDRKNCPPSTTRDDTSSVYGSESGGQLSASGFSATTSRRSSLRNPNSLAIGGRSVSEAPPRRTRATGYTASSVNDIQSRQRTLDGSRETDDRSDITDTSFVKTRSFSMPARHKLPEADTVTKFSCRQADHNTETNEHMSEISVGFVRKKHNENFSEAEAQLSAVIDSANRIPGQTDEDRLVQGDHSDLNNLSIGEDTNKKSPYRLPILNEFHQRISLESPSQRPMAIVSRRAARQRAQKLENSPTLQQPQAAKQNRRASTMGISDTGQPAVMFETNSYRRSQSADVDPSPAPIRMAKEKLHRKSLPILDFISSVPISTKAQTWIDRGKLKKKSILDVGRRFTNVGVPNEDNYAKNSTKVRNVLSIWTGFPSHSRDQRNGVAAETDGVRTRDFTEGECAADLDSILPNRSTASFGPCSPASRRFLSMAETKLNRNKTKSLNFNIGLEERAKRSRKGFVGRFRRLYRSSSSDFRAFANMHGHRSSISLGQAVEYPELECFPAERLFVPNRNDHQVRSKDIDGTTDHPAKDGSPPTSHSEYSTRALTSESSADRVDLYAGCVRGLSALHSSSDTPRTRLPNLGFIMRSSTEEFEADPAMEAAEAKARLLRQVQNNTSSVSHEVHEDKMARLSVDLKIPGSFE